MSTRSSLAYIEYERKKGNLHIYFEMMDCTYQMQDEESGIVELPENIAKDFANILNTKYKHLIPKDPMFEKWKKEQEKEKKCKQK